MIDLPLPKRFIPEEMPKRLAQLVRQEKAKLPAPPPVVPETPQDKEQPKPEPVETPKPPEQPPETTDIAQAEPQAAEPLPSVPPSDTPGPGSGPGAAKQRVAKAGILAFKEEFASLAQDNVAPRLGANARYGDADEASRASAATRSMLTTNAPGSSGGINLGSISRNVGGGGGGGGGGGIHGVQVGQATSSIAGIGGGSRPMARGGPGPSRTDEEIQIVFDRYKASFYRLYNRELRNDPTLQGQMVLRLTIEPDGSVSMCKLESSDMDAPDLATQVVQRVLTINFGSKEGVQALTIVYPIDFLPAA
jgi:outer membrane biosynthesis protein TonB